MPTAYQDEIARIGSPEIGILFPDRRRSFVARQRLPSNIRDMLNELPRTSPHSQEKEMSDVLVRLPSIRDSKWKITVLQQWTGRVEHVSKRRITAVITDATNPGNPPEEVDLDMEEVSSSDLPLVAQGAVFYWTIGYQDSPGGQRERVSTLRFARQPRLGDVQLNRIFERAERIAMVLESD
jgi:hypothetical protein